MAITWAVKITPVNITNKIVSIRATRTDDSTTPETIYSVSMNGADISTTEKKNEALNILWNKYLTKAAQQTSINTFIGDLEDAAKTNLEGREI